LRYRLAKLAWCSVSGGHSKNGARLVLVGQGSLARPDF
jgi:hypothetical protein